MNREQQKHKCPVCGSHATRECGPGQRTCTLCRTTDAQRMFVVPGTDIDMRPIETAKHPAVALEDKLIAADREMIASTPLGNGTTMNQFFVPDEIAEAEQRLHAFFSQQGVKHWAFGHVQSRDPDEHPNLAAAGLTGLNASDIDLPMVRRLAAAFGCRVSRWPAPGAQFDAVARAAYEAAYPMSSPLSSWEELEEAGRARWLRVALAVLNATSPSGG